MVLWDCNNQYMDFFQYLRNCFKNHDNLFYSFSAYLGGGMVQFAAYYWLSPFNLLIFCFSEEKMYAAFSLLYILKISVAGLAFYSFLNYNRKKIGWIGVVFSAAYALNIFNLVYSFHIMWLDGVILLPYIMIGLEKLRRGQGVKLYIITLSCAIISNFYIGYMLCIASVLYFVTALAFFGGRKRIVPFAASSLAAGGLSACVWIPMWYSMQGGKASFDKSIFTFETKFSWSDFARSLVKLDFDPNQLWNGPPNIFCGFITLIFAVLFLANRNILWRKRLAVLMIILILCISFWIQALDLVWHGFNFPRSFPYRYSFLFSFWILFMAAEGCYEILGTEQKERQKRKAEAVKKSVFFLAGVLEMALLVSSGIQVIGRIHDFASLNIHGYEDFHFKTNEAVKEIEKTDAGFFRMEKDLFRTYNDAMASSFPGASHFSSCMKGEVCDFAKKAGVPGSDISIRYFDSNTQALDSFLGIKYFLDYDGLVNKNYEHVMDKNGVAIYKNPYALPVMFSTDSDEITEYLHSDTPFQVQGEIYRKIAPGVEVFTEITDIEKQYDGTLECSFYIQEEKPVYLNTKIYRLKSLDIYADSVKIRSFNKETNRSVQYVGTFPKGARISIRADVKKSDKIKKSRINLVYENEDALAEAEQRVGRGDLHKISSSHLKGTITANQADSGKLLFMIPFDAQWKCYVDGKRAQQERALDIFMSIPIDSGRHDIELYYRPKGVAAGCAVALGTALCLLGFWKGSGSSKHNLLGK